MFTRRWLILCALTGATFVWGADKYQGPRPPKPDTPYLLHASNLVETEAVEAKQEDRKDGTLYVVTGAASPVRTPLAEPIFLIQSEKILPDKLQLYRVDTKDGRREIFFSEKKRKDNRRPIHLIVNKVAEGLYRVEANEELENGEYTLTPEGSNQVFCFQVY
jgi:hypothetical protein